MIASGAYSGGSLMNNLDLGSNFASTSLGISHTVTNAMGIITPVIVGALTRGRVSIPLPKLSLQEYCNITSQVYTEKFKHLRPLKGLHIAKRPSVGHEYELVQSASRHRTCFHKIHFSFHPMM